MPPASATSGLYCPGCNAFFPPGGAERECPRCHMPLVSRERVDTLQPTFLWRGTVSTAIDGSHVPETREDEHRLQALAGTDLHIYRIESLLGRGGMGWVFLAQHRDLARLCAVKILAPRLAAKDPDFLARFQNEGRAAAALVHPNIITTHAIGAADDLYYLEMEFVRGRSLQQRINDGPFAPLQALAIACRSRQVWPPHTLKGSSIAISNPTTC